MIMYYYPTFILLMGMTNMHLSLSMMMTPLG